MLLYGFTLKQSRSATMNGSVHLHKLIKLSRYLPAYLKKIVDPVLQRNAYRLRAQLEKRT